MALQPQFEHDNVAMTEVEYLSTEPLSEVRREYIDGRVYAMAGGSTNHNILATNVLRKLGNHLEGTPCITFMSEIKVALKAATGQNYVYPDVIVDCNPTTNDGFATSPVIIVEVLSKSTRRLDTSTKLLRYINLPTLKEYILVEQDFVAVQVLRRDNHWQSEYFYLGDRVIFESINLTLSVEEIYDRVNNDDMQEFRQHLQVVE
ncbi:MAG: Uma2 family endonuclease [Methylococcales bacterium]